MRAMFRGPLRALTLTQPWAGLVASGIKLIENRPKPPPAVMIGQRFAIHASREIDQLVFDRIYEIDPGLRPELATTREQSRWHQLARIKSAIIGVGTLLSFAEDLEGLRASGCVSEDQERWYFPPSIGYMLADVRPLERPIPIKGMLGFWTIPHDEAAEITRQLQ